jgi:two-component system nitrogen regulation sensor histidine kinase GlnL
MVANPLGETILESLDTAIVVVDQHLVVRAVNIACEELFATSRRNMVDQLITDFIDNNEVELKAKDCLETQSQYTLREISIDASNEAQLVDVTLSYLPQEGEDACVIYEISSINRISRFMREKTQLERQHSFQLMVRGLAHEIKNPLGGIRGAAQLLDRQLDKPDLKEYTDVLIKEADRLTRLVDRVMGNREQIKPEPVNIHEILEHVVHLVSVKKGPVLHVNRAYDPALPEIRVDREQIIQAVLNVVGNAIEAQNGEDSAVIGLVTQFDRFFTVRQVMYRRVLKIMIWDEGPGVPDDLREIIFDPLITGRPEGTGLGLSITQTIVQRHKGVVALEDYKGKTCFAIYLPYIEQELEQDE